MEEPSILLTNDDGIDSAGFRTLYEGLADVGSVTAVAPATDKSAIGRAISGDVTVHEHERGYAIEGTPADCVVAGIEALVPDVDMVIAGINRGANLGAYVLGRSGTVSAAVEATFFGVPAMAVSTYIPAREDVAFRNVAVDSATYDEAVRAARFLVENAPEAGVFEQCDYLNVNAPAPEDGPAPMAVTFPSEVYQMSATRDGGAIQLHDRIWERMAEGEIPDPEGSDRRAVVDGEVSVSPLTAPHTTEHHEALDGLVAAYPGNE
jgi:5'-nucleotidase